MDEFFEKRALLKNTQLSLNAWWLVDDLNSETSILKRSKF